MTDTLTTAKSLTKQTVGGNSGTWGTILNSTLDLIDKGLGQTLTKALTVSVTLTATEAQNIGYDFTGAIAAPVTVTFPTFYGPAFIRNKTTGGFAVTVAMASGLTVRVPFGSSAVAFSDGTDFVLPIPPPGAVNAFPADPTPRAGALVMMGLGASCYITPTRSGTVMFQISGLAANSTAGCGVSIRLWYGTGTPPANAAAVTGTQISAEMAYTNTNADHLPFTAHGVVSGLTVGTVYWFDLSLAIAIGGTASVISLTGSAVES